MRIWSPRTGRYAYMTNSSGRTVTVGQTIRYDNDEWLIISVRAPTGEGSNDR